MRLKTRPTFSMVLGALLSSASAGCGGEATEPTAETVSFSRAEVAVSSSSPAPARLTDPNWKQIKLPSDAELIATAEATPSDQRHFWGWNESKQEPMGWVIVGHDPDVFPVFSHGGEVLGIGVAGIGLISRQQLSDPQVDLEQLARDKWGPKYQQMLGSSE